MMQEPISPGMYRNDGHIVARNVRIVLTADNHLSAYTPKLSPLRLAERRRRLGAAFRQTVDLAIERQADLFIQAGDLFDSIDPRNLERRFVAQQLGRLKDADIRSFAVSGNHDTPRQKTEQGGVAPHEIYHHLGALHYFASSDKIIPVLLKVAGLRVAVAGLSYQTGVMPGSDPLDSVEIDDPKNILAEADLRILILHAAIEGHGFPGEMETMVRRSSLARFNCFQIVLAGHVHAYRRSAIGDMEVVVCGATERMEFGQREGNTGCVYLEVSPKGLQRVEHVPIQPQPRAVVTIRTTELWPVARSCEEQMGNAGNESVEVYEAAQVSITERILQKVEPCCTKDTMVRLVLEGPVTREQYHQLDLRAILLYGQNRAFSFEVDESGLLLKYDLFHDSIERGERVAPREILESVVNELMGQAATAEERAIIQKTRLRVLDSYDALAGKEIGQ